MWLVGISTVEIAMTRWKWMLDLTGFNVSRNSDQDYTIVEGLAGLMGRGK